MIPFRSPIPRTEVSMWVAPASRAQKALATAVKSQGTISFIPTPPLEKEGRPLTASGIVVEMALNVATDDSSQSPDEIVHLSRVGTPHGVGDSDTSDSNLVDSAVDAEQVDQVGSERILGRESNFESLGFNKLDHLDRGLDDEGDVFSVGILAEERRGSDDDVDSIHTWTTGTGNQKKNQPRPCAPRSEKKEELTSLDRDPRVVHMTPDMSQDLALQSHVADLDAVLTTLLGSGGRSEFNVLYSKVGQGLRDLHLGFRVEERIRELFSLC